MDASMNQTPPTPELTTEAFLAQLRERRDTAIAQYDYWTLSRQDLMRAYEAGERNFVRADLGGADLYEANLRGADLSGAYLGGADLREANLRGADLSGAYLGGADLREANLRGANLYEADLSGAYLGEADLREANLREADLSGAYLGGADLREANLRGANLYEANLYEANLYEAQADFLSKCMVRPHELAGLRLALVEGRVNGSTYEGECACFVGTLANVAKCDYRKLEGIEPNSSSPIERLFVAIHEGDTPETNPVSKIVVGWLDELMSFASIYAAGIQETK